MINLNEAAFAVADVSAITGVREVALRDWHSRGLGQFLGNKIDHRWLYSTREIAAISVTADLIRLGFPIPIAANAACVLVDGEPKPGLTFKGSPQAICDLAPEPGSTARRHREDLRAPDVQDAVIELPIGDIWARTIERAEAVRHRAGCAA
jgi:DNA-binding transcriptional MerR regulator